jgi:hypothetical protein
LFPVILTEKSDQMISSNGVLEEKSDRLPGLEAAELKDLRPVKGESQLEAIVETLRFGSVVRFSSRKALETATRLSARLPCDEFLRKKRARNKSQESFATARKYALAEGWCGP